MATERKYDFSTDPTEDEDMQLLKYWRVMTIVALVAIAFQDANCSSQIVFVAQSAGTLSEGTACNGQTAESIATFNAGSESAGHTYYFCGTLTTAPVINGSGTSGNLITFKWDTGARISVPYGQMIHLNNGNNAYLLFDGGIPCGPGTACATLEEANPTGYVAGQAGIVEATANGSALANQNANTQAFWGCTNGCHDIEIRNLIIRNLYQHTLMTDQTPNIDGGDYVIEGVPFGSGIISIHDNNIHDGGNQINIASTTGGTTLNVYNNDFWHNNWAVAPTGAGTRTVNIHDNHFHDASNWDTSTDAFHHNGVHLFMTAATDSLALNVYNNLSDGDWGDCCTTATQVFIDTGGFAVPDNVNLFNNVVIQHAGNLAPAWAYSATTGTVLNNTAIGVCATPSNTYALGIGSGATNISIENNVFQCYGQFIQDNPGAQITVMDYNSYGPPGISGAGSWDYQNTGYTSFSAWQARCSCDSHSQYKTNLSVNSNGIQQSGSVLIGAGTNLTSLNITALDSTTSAGSTIPPVARPATGSWDAGAYSASTLGTPNALTGNAVQVPQ